MGVVAGADEAGQTPQAAAQKLQTAARTAQAFEQAPGTSPSAAPTADQAQGSASIAEQSSVATNHAAQSSRQQTPETEPSAEQTPTPPGFGERGRMRRRARFLRKARELAYRDLGGLVFDLHRFGQRNDPLVLAKLATLREIDTELRGLEDGLRDHRPVTVLREVGIAACPRCAAIHGSDDRFCPGCGLTFDANADRPISTAPVIPQATAMSAPVQPPLAATPVATAQASTPATAWTSSPASAANPTSASSPAPTSNPAPTSAHAPAPTTGPATPPQEPTVSPIAAKPTGTPAVAVKPFSSPAVKAKPAASPAASEPKAPEPAQEDEPTQILRPPRGDAGA